jgi:hypothetical protein
MTLDPQKPRPPQMPVPPPDIRVMEAIADGYTFIKDNFNFLLKASLLPIGVHFLLAILFMRGTTPDSQPESLYMSFLLTLPSVVLFGWYIFVQTRLQIMGERYTNLPAEKEYRLARRSDLTVCLCCYVLFKMAFMLLLQFMALGIMGAEGAAAGGPRPGQTFIVILGLAVMVWGTKFSVIHLVAAAGADLRGYVRRVKGLWFSFILIGLGFIAMLPVLLVFVFLAGFLFQDPEEMSVIATVMLHFLAAGFSWSILMVLNAVAIEALKQLYQQKRVSAK